jgi:tetratricopeptide (TPR) repeat protein/tRNA A-37 threonylcarbamoyl transferase component Bud32
MAETSEPNKPVFKELTGRIGKYEIVRLLGKGAMGQVYLARDPDLDREVALKVMAAQIADDPELKRRFEREAKAVAKMKHRNVVMVFDRGTHTDGSPYIAMEYLEGQDLHKAMRQIPPLTLEEKVTIIVQVLAGLADAHDKGIYHRDIKPANIFIQKDGTAKIMDFGVAHVTAASMTGITGTGSVMGTADYMSPEQVKGEKKIDGRSDLFSVGCMLFELAAGRRPFHSDNLMAIFYKITHEEANLDLIPQGAEYDALMPILKKALAKNVEERYQTAYEFAVDLREWLRAHATTASSQNVLEALVDLEAPTHAPLPATDAPGVTSVPEGVTVDLGRRGPRKPPLAPTRVGGRTAAEAGPGTTRRPGTTRVAAPPSPRVTARPVPAAKPTVPVWVAVVLALVVSVVGWLVWKNMQAAVTPPVTQAAATPTPAPPSPAPTATPTPPPVTVAPAPKFAEAGGKAAAQIRSAQAAFKTGSYDRAVAAAQEALREDPANANALKVLENAQNGQKALLQLRAAEAALARGDFDAAESELDGARRLAPWDGSVVDFSPRIAEARARARRDAEAKVQSARTIEINSALDKAATALQNKQYEAAIAAYDQALAIDPANAAAAQGKQAAIGAKAIAEAAASGPRPGGVRTFVAGRTEAKGIEQGGLVGFEDSAGVQVKKGTQAAELPGRIVFETSPVAPKPGERFRVSVFLSNEGPQAIQLATLTVSTTVDGKPQRGPVPLLATTVAPFQRAPVFQTPGDQVWREGTQSWVMEVVLHTTKGETYRNTLSWK